MPTPHRGKSAKEVLEQMSVSAPKTASTITPFGALNELIRKNAETVIDPERCDNLVDMLLGSEKQVLPSEDASKLLSVADVGALLISPYFIRACARRGCMFYVAADGGVHRQMFSKIPASKESKAAVAAQAPVLDAAVDPNYFAEPPWFDALSKFVDRDCPVLLIGPAGCGKSEAVERVFALRKQVLQIVSCTPAMSADDFEGRVDLRGGETQFTHAPSAIAVRDGHGLLLDEADAAPAEACYSLYRALTGKDMRIARQGYDGVVSRHASFRTVGTQNTEGRGDDRGLYHGRAHQDEAFLDRWGNYIRVDYPAPDIECAILVKKTGVPKKHADKIVKVAVELRKALRDRKILLAVTLRRTIAVTANIAAGFTPEDAWRFGVQNRATEEDDQVVADFVNRVYGSNAKKCIG